MFVGTLHHLLFGSLFDCLDIFLLKLFLFNFFIVDHWLQFVNFSKEMTTNGFEINLIVDSFKFIFHIFKALLFLIIFLFKITEQWFWLIDDSFKQFFLLQVINLLFFLDIFKEVSRKFMTLSLVIFVKRNNFLLIFGWLFTGHRLIFCVFNSIKKTFWLFNNTSQAKSRPLSLTQRNHPLFSLSKRMIVHFQIHFQVKNT